MNISDMLLFLLYIGLFTIVLVVIFRLTIKKPSPHLKKTPARYVNISSSNDVETFMDVYTDLTWKPDKEVSYELSPEIENSLEKIDNISPLITELSSRLNDPDINPKEISKLIINDQGLTSFILKRVNSPFYGLVQKIDNIFNAIVILGYNEIYRMVMEERTRKVGIKPETTEWVHANLTSHIAAYLSSTSRIGVRGGTMVTLGMLHDIAKTIMHKALKEPAESLPTDPRERLQREIDVYGIDHATLGGILARRWGMPDILSTCIERHHWPMFWPLRELGQDCTNILKELSILSISDIAAKNFTEEIRGIYIGNDYFRFINKSANIESILRPEITRDLKRISNMGKEMDQNTQTV